VVLFDGSAADMARDEKRTSIDKRNQAIVLAIRRLSGVGMTISFLLLRPQENGVCSSHSVLSEFQE